MPPGFSKARCVTSPLKRARETARLLGLRAEWTDPRLMEMNWGEFEGKRLVDLRASLGTDMADLEGRGLDFRPPGGESPREVAGRLASFCTDMALEGGGDVLAVAHKGLLRAALVIACGWDMLGKPPVKFDPERALLLDIASDGSLSLQSVVDLRA